MGSITQDSKIFCLKGCVWWFNEYQDTEDRDFKASIEKILKNLREEEFETAFTETKKALSFVKSNYKNLILSMTAGNCAHILNRRLEAENFYKNALEIINPFLRDHHADELVIAQAILLVDIALYTNNRQSLEFSLVSFMNFAMTFAKSDANDKALQMCDIALELARKVGSKMEEAIILTNEGTIARKMGRLSEALTLLNNALGVISDQSNPLSAEVFAEIGRTHEQSGLLEAALVDYINAANIKVKFVESQLGMFKGSISHGSSMHIQTLMQYVRKLFDLCISLKKYESALPILQQALHFFQSIKMEDVEVNLLINIAGVYFTTGDYKTAVDFLKQALPLHQKLGQREQEIQCLKSLDNVYNKMERYEEAIKYAQPLLNFYITLGHYYYALDQFEHLQDLYRRTGNQSEANKIELDKNRFLTEMIEKSKRDENGKEITYTQKDGQLYAKKEGEAEPHKVDFELALGPNQFVKLSDLAKNPNFAKNFKVVGFTPSKDADVFFDSKKKSKSPPK